MHFPAFFLKKCRRIIEKEPGKRILNCMVLFGNGNHERNHSQSDDQKDEHSVRVSRNMPASGPEGAVYGAFIRDGRHSRQSQ